jgi:uncharacterized membrane protein HdeD (DUF308 family)
MIVTSPLDTVRSWTRDQVESISRGWWVLLLTGVISVVAGVIVAFGDWTVGDLVVFVGTLLIIRGFFTAFSVPVDGSLRTWSVVLGLLEVGVGVSVWIWPDPTLLIVAAYIGWLLLFRGVMTIIGSIFSRRFVPYWGVVLVAGIIEVLVAIYLLGRPDLTLVATVLAVGLAGARPVRRPCRHAGRASGQRAVPRRRGVIASRYGATGPAWSNSSAPAR